MRRQLVNMANLTTTSSLVKKLVFPLIILLVIIGLVILIFFRYRQKPQENQVANNKTPEAPVIKQDPKQRPPSFIDLTQIPKKQFPKTLPVYSLTKYAELPQDEAQQIAGALGFANPPFLIDKNTSEGIQYNWQIGDVSLTISPLSLRYKNSNSSNSSIPLNQDQLINIARDFIERISISPKDLQFNLKKTSYLKKIPSQFASAPSFELADLAELHFETLTEGLPLIPNNPDSSTVIVRIAKNGDIASINVRLYKELVKGQDFGLKDFDQAKNEILQGRGKVVQTYLLDENGQALELFSVLPTDIKNLQIKDVYLAYYLQDKDTSIQPIYVFEGTFKKGDQNGKAWLYLPAIK